ncbi:hypothetical protein CI102_1447 [Trichoderma harzianum]|nr:hypothetical protein CI102_1447 [Trichoderma harzianum]
MQIGHGVVRHTPKRAAARQVRRPGTSAPDGRTLFRTSTSTFGVPKRKSDLLRYETLQPQSLDVLFDLFSWCMHGRISVCMLVMMCLFLPFAWGYRRNRCTYSTVDSSHWPSPIHGFLRGTPRSGPGAASLVVGAWRDVTLLLCICVMPVPVQQYEHTHHPLPPVIVIYSSLFSTRSTMSVPSTG